DAARRALAAGLDRAELHGEPRLLAHVDGIVEDDEAAVADHGAYGGELLVVERRVELRRVNISSERPAGLDGPDRPARRAAAAEVVKDFAQRRPESELDQAPALDVAGELDRQRAA